MIKTCIYKITYIYHSPTSRFLKHIEEQVEAPSNISYSEMERLCIENIPGFYYLKCFEVYRRKFV